MILRVVVTLAMLVCFGSMYAADQSDVSTLAYSGSYNITGKVNNEGKAKLSVVTTKRAIKWQCPKGYVFPKALVKNIPANGKVTILQNNSENNIIAVNATIIDFSGNMIFRPVKVRIKPMQEIMGSNNQNIDDGVYGSSVVCVRPADDTKVIKINSREMV